MTPFLCFVILFIAVPHAVRGEVCAYVLTQDCNFLPDMNRVCGTDGTSYRNNCALAKAYCQDNTIHKAHDGPCTGATTTTAQPTTLKPIDGGQVALDIFCLDLIYINCPAGGVQVCGSDGTFYVNICEFDKARCFHRDLVNGKNC
ncbi:agrin-like [Mya arenaria]|uniref:agrin-like n=1 Tax=Mya arenaria TaxID=6604 RepID=UPI0022E62BC3|nr:agrin-like [Mya arenaria]